MRSLVHSTTRSGHSSADDAQPGARNGSGAGQLGFILGILAALAVFGLAELVHHSGHNRFELPDSNPNTIGETK